MGSAKGRAVGPLNLVAYGLGDLYGSGSFVLISLLFIFFLTDVVGLPASTAGLVVMVGKGWDALSDPLMGYISDRTRTRLGRRRIFFVVGVVPIAVSFFLLWLPLGSVSNLYAFCYYSFAYVLFSSVFTMVMVPYSALNAEMSRDYYTRTRLTGARLICGGVAALLVGVLPKLIIEAVGDPQQGHAVMGLVFGLLFALPWLLVTLGTWEEDLGQKQVAPSSFVDFFANLRTIFVNRSFRIHLGLYIGAYSALDVLMALALYYLTYYFERKDLFPICLGAMLATQLLSLIAYVGIANRFGKAVAYVLGLSVWAVAMIFGLFLSRGSSTAHIVGVFVIAGAGMSAGAMIPWAILPSVIDVDELITSEQRAGVYAGAMTLMRKLAQAGVLLLVGYGLERIGYVANVPQSPQTLQQMKWMFFLLPVCGIGLGIAFALRFRVTPTTHRVLTQELERLRAGGQKTDVDPQTRDVCELLTGLPYERLYGSGTMPPRRGDP